MSSQERCPFCNERRSRHGAFMCGTKLDTETGDYETGSECDAACFRNAYLRCLELLREVSNCGIEYEAGKYKTVQVDNATWDAIQREVDHTPKEATNE